MNTSIVTHIRRWYARSLINRVGLSMQLLLLFFFSVIGSVAFVSLFEEVDSRVKERLEHGSLLHARLLEDAFDHVFFELAAVSTEPSLREALSDHNKPKLSLSLQAIKRISVDLSSFWVVDKNGMILSETTPSGDWLNLMNGHHSGAPKIKYFKENENPYIGFAYPVTDPNTAEIHGAIIGKVSLPGVIHRVVEKNEQVMPDLLVEIRDARGDVLYASAASSDQEKVSVQRRLQGNLAAYGIDLSLIVSKPLRSIYFLVLPRVLMLCAVAGVLLLMGFFLIRKLAIQTMEPIALMAHRAHEIAHAGPGGLVTLSVHGEDEIGEMGKAFNAMVHSLKMAYQQLELRVSQRTEALVKAESRLSEVLANTDDLIFSAAGDWHCFY